MFDVRFLTKCTDRSKPIVEIKTMSPFRKFKFDAGYFQWSLSRRILIFKDVEL